MGEGVGYPGLALRDPNLALVGLGIGISFSYKASRYLGPTFIDLGSAVKKLGLTTMYQARMSASDFVSKLGTWA